MNEGDIGCAAQIVPVPVAAGDEPVEDPEPPSGPSAAHGVELDISVEAGDWSAFEDAEHLIRIAADALAQHPEAVGIRSRGASVALADDATVQRLNAAYRGKDAPTNVLSFPFEPPPGAPPEETDRYLGDIILAAETLLREAADLGIPPSDHLQHLVVHGLLHLLGFDHIEDAEAEAMEAIETRVLAGLGIADPYAS